MHLKNSKMNSKQMSTSDMLKMLRMLKVSNHNIPAIISKLEERGLHALAEEKYGPECIAKIKSISSKTRKKISNETQNPEKKEIGNKAEELRSKTQNHVEDGEIKTRNPEKEMKTKDQDPEEEIEAKKQRKCNRSPQRWQRQGSLE